MPHTDALRAHSSLGQKWSKFVNGWRAKKLCGEISRELATFESRFLKTRAHPR